MKKYSHLISLVFTVFLFFTIQVTVRAENIPEISSPSGILIEAETGTILYEKDKDTQRSPASVTKIMTLLLIFDNLKSQTISLQDIVTTSAHAKSMGGSQVFLEEGETQSVETLIKCIVIASGNDASVAMAEFIAGTEEAFVEQMNQRAEGLGMTNTHFEDCCGLTDSDKHYTTAGDIAVMSRELITEYPEIFQYSSIWMENIVHETRQGTQEFGLTNTNRLIRTYPGCIGLKTGSTSKAGFCLSAVAQRDDITLISVVMAAPDYKARLNDASALLDYGFSRCSLYTDSDPEPLPNIAVRRGTSSSVTLKYEKNFKYLNTDGTKTEDVHRELVLPESVNAPVEKGDTAGEVIYTENNRELGRISIFYAESIEKLNFNDCLLLAVTSFWL